MDAENLVASWLRTQTGKRVGNEVPSDLHTDFIQVARMGGSDRYWGYVDDAMIEVNYFGQDRGSAIAGAEEVRELILHSLPGSLLDGHVVWTTDTATAPMWVPWDNTNVRRIYATYVVTLR